jgi:hypothetical protein
MLFGAQKKNKGKKKICIGKPISAISQQRQAYCR